MLNSRKSRSFVSPTPRSTFISIAGSSPPQQEEVRSVVANGTSPGSRSDEELFFLAAPGTVRPTGEEKLEAAADTRDER